MSAALGSAGSLLRATLDGGASDASIAGGARSPVDGARGMSVGRTRAPAQGLAPWETGGEAVDKGAAVLRGGSRTEVERDVGGALDTSGDGEGSCAADGSEAGGASDGRGGDERNGSGGSCEDFAGSSVSVSASSAVR